MRKLCLCTPGGEGKPLHSGNSRVLRQVAARTQPAWFPIASGGCDVAGFVGNQLHCLCERCEIGLPLVCPKPAARLSQDLPVPAAWEGCWLSPGPMSCCPEAWRLDLSGPHLREVVVLRLIKDQPPRCLDLQRIWLLTPWL